MIAIMVVVCHFYVFVVFVGFNSNLRFKNKKSSTYGTSDLSIYQLCYHMGSALSGADQSAHGRGSGADPSL